MEALIEELEHCALTIEANSSIMSAILVLRQELELLKKDNEILQTFVGVQPKQIYINALNSALEG